MNRKIGIASSKEFEGLRESYKCNVLVNPSPMIHTINIILFTLIFVLLSNSTIYRKRIKFRGV